jgi:3-deoxy-D-manno-octulosonic-acid transferase
LAASTHPGEEKLVAEIFARLRKRRPELKLVVVPRHAERGGEVASDLATTGLRVARRSVGDDAGGGADILLADTTGEMLAFINASDIVVMGKSFAGHDEGHNVIEPAALGKPVVTGRVARNFRQVLEIMTRENAVMAVDGGVGLEESLNELLDDPEKRVALGERAKTAVEKARGATDRTIELCEKLLS